MKKLLICCLTCLFILCSCASLANTPVYKATAYSINYADESISKDDKILILFETGNFMLQREVESSIVDALSKNGINAIAYSSIEIESQPSTVEYLDRIAWNNRCKYIMYVHVSDVYTYTTGGGIAELRFNADMFDLDSSRFNLRITGAINCKENLYHSYTESIAPAGKCIANAIVDEYMKHVEGRASETAV